jgi:hypothetical protein
MILAVHDFAAAGVGAEGATAEGLAVACTVVNRTVYSAAGAAAGCGSRLQVPESSGPTKG